MTIMNLTGEEDPAISDTILTKREEPMMSGSFSVIECGLWFCVNSYQSTVTNGILTEIIQPIAAKVQPGFRQPIRNVNGGYKRIFPPRNTNTNTNIHEVTDLRSSGSHVQLYFGQFGRQTDGPTTWWRFQYFSGCLLYSDRFIAWDLDGWN